MTFYYISPSPPVFTRELCTPSELPPLFPSHPHILCILPTLLGDWLLPDPLPKPPWPGLLWTTPSLISRRIYPRISCTEPQPQRVSVALTHFLLLTQMDHSAMVPVSTRPLWRENVTLLWTRLLGGPQRQQRLLVSKDNRHTVIKLF